MKAKLFKSITKVQGMSEPMVDWYEGETEAQAKAIWDEDCHRYGLPMERTSVEFIQCDPKTLQPITKEQQIEAIAEKFSAILNEWLTAEQMAEVNRRNATPEYASNDSCASHDFCDSNEAMAEAFEAVLGRECLLPCDVKDDQSEFIQAECDIMNAAWNIAKANGFAVKAEVAK